MAPHLIKHIFFKHNGINLVIDFLKREDNFEFVIEYFPIEEKHPKIKYMHKMKYMFCAIHVCMHI